MKVKRQKAVGAGFTRKEGVALKEPCNGLQEGKCCHSVHESGIKGLHKALTQRKRATKGDVDWGRKQQRPLLAHTSLTQSPPDVAIKGGTNSCFFTRYLQVN